MTFGISPRSGSIVLLAAVGLALGQDQSTEGTRQLYYLATPSSGSVPPLPKGDAPGGLASDAGTVHMGLRYNLLLIGSDRRAQQVASDHVFKEGDCFAIDLETNKEAYVYVLARQSSGSWTPLSDMPGQRSTLPARKKVRIPSESCFVVHNPPGTESLFVVLSRDPRDFYELYESVKSKEGGTDSSRESGKLNAAVEHLDEKFGGSRDITIAKIGQPTRADEPRGAVYVVNTSQNRSTTLVTRIPVRHN